MINQFEQNRKSTRKYSSNRCGIDQSESTKKNQLISYSGSITSYQQLWFRKVLYNHNPINQFDCESDEPSWTSGEQKFHIFRNLRNQSWLNNRNNHIKFFCDAIRVHRNWIQIHNLIVNQNHMKRSENQPWQTASKNPKNNLKLAIS